MSKSDSQAQIQGIDEEIKGLEYDLTVPENSTDANLKTMQQIEDLHTRRNEIERKGTSAVDTAVGETVQDLKGVVFPKANKDDDLQAQIAQTKSRIRGAESELDNPEGNFDTRSKVEDEIRDLETHLAALQKQAAVTSHREDLEFNADGSRNANFPRE